MRRDKCIEEIHYYVYRYALKRFKANPDLASDFYTNIYNKIQSFFEEYNPNLNIDFSIFLAVKLKNYYLKFITMTMSKEKDIYFEEYQDWNTLAHTVTHEKSNFKIHSLLEKELHNTFNQLDIEVQICIRLRYGFFLNLKHFRYLIDRWQGFAFLNLYKKYTTKLDTWNVNEKEKKEKILLEILSMDNSINLSHKKELIKNNKIIKLNTVKEPTGLKEIGLIIKKNSSYVYRQIKHGQKVIKIILSDEMNKIQNS